MILAFLSCARREKRAGRKPVECTGRPHAVISGEAARMNFLAAQGKTSTSLLARPFHPGRTVWMSSVWWWRRQALRTNTRTRRTPRDTSVRGRGKHRVRSAFRSTSNCDVVGDACPRSRFKTVSTALLELFLSSPGSPSSFRLRSRVYACAASNWSAAARPSRSSYKSCRNICTRGIRACITRAVNVWAWRWLASHRRYFALSLSLAPSQVSIFSFSLSLSSPFLLYSALYPPVWSSSIHSRSRRGKSCPKVFCSTLMKLYGPGERQFVRLSRLLRVEGGGSPPLEESALFRVGRLFKTLPWKVLCASVLYNRAHARTHARTRLLFGSVSSGRAGPVSLSAFLIAPRSAPGRSRL